LASAARHSATRIWKASPVPVVEAHSGAERQLAVLIFCLERLDRFGLVISGQDFGICCPAFSPPNEPGRIPFLNEGGHTLSAIATGSRDAMYNLATAAAAVGRNKNAILRAIEAGKIPVSQDANGDMLIDPADLHHLYPPLRTDGTQQQRLYQSPLLMPVGG
jgi:hypothetical protein